MNFFKQKGKEKIDEPNISIETNKENDQLDKMSAMSKDEFINYLSTLNEEQLKRFCNKKYFSFLEKHIFSDEHPEESLNKLPEKTSKTILVTYFVSTFYINDYNGMRAHLNGTVDENKTKDYAIVFKNIWDNTKYESTKKFAAQIIWPYYKEIAEYMVLNQIDLGIRERQIGIFKTRKDLLGMINNKEVLEFVAKDEDKTS